jgi:triosephosphate isomerase
MMRRLMMCGNWKMNETTGEAVRLSQDILNHIDSEGEDIDVVLLPPSIDLKSVSNVIAFDHSGVMLGAQNCHWESSGAYTGEISPAMLVEVGCTWCIVGHSERRQMFGETDETVNRKVKALIAQRIHPIICVGETMDCREAGETIEFVSAQVRAALDGVSVQAATSLAIAYEPIWAIGTGQTPTPELANDVCGAIRAAVAGLYDASMAEVIRVIYGGSMKPSNVKQFLPMPHIDGGLVGGAALKADSFADLVKAASEWSYRRALKKQD